MILHVGAGKRPIFTEILLTAVGKNVTVKRISLLRPTMIEHLTSTGYIFLP